MKNVYAPGHQRDFTTTVPLFVSTFFVLASKVVHFVSYDRKSQAGHPPLVSQSAVIGLSLGTQGSLLISLSNNSSGGTSSSPGAGLGSACLILPYFKIAGV